MLHARMSLQMRADMTQRHKILYREIASVSHRGIVARSGMALGKHEAVSVRILRVLRINVHLLKIQVCKNICCGKRSARMSSLCTVYCSHNAFANFVRHFL